MPPDASQAAAAAAPADIRTRQEFAEALTDLRQRAGLTVRQVADAVGVPASTLGGYFSGRHLPPVSQPHLLPAILRACGVADDETTEQWQRALGRLRRTPGPRTAAAEAPYRGLACFQPDDSEWFFGRRELTLVVLARLDRRWSTGEGPVAVVGPSGSGKSSVLRAGVVPAALRGEVGASGARDWPVLLLTPGPRPLDALAAEVAAVTGDDAATVAQDLREHPGRSSHHARRARAAARAGGLLVVVDQFEEVYTEGADEDERHAFIKALNAMSSSAPAAGSSYATGPPGTPDGADRPSAAVVLGLRADFYHRALREPQLLPVLQRSQVAVGPMSEPELREAITGPARKAGLEVEDGLVEVVLRDLSPTAPTGGEAAHDAGALPLLSHALLATWERRTGDRLTVAAYRAAGGIEGSVAQTADAVVDSFTGTEKEVARRLFVRLVRVGVDVPHTRRRISRDELDRDLPPGATPEAVAGVLDRLVQHRLVTVDADTLEISHESLIAAWPRLREWIDADRRGLIVGQQLDDAARQWQREQRDPDLLYRGSRLAAAREWADGGGQPTAAAREFLHASTRRAQRRTRALYGVIAALAALLLIAVAGGAYAYQQREEAVAARAVATEERNAALSRMVAIRADRLRETDPALARQLSLTSYEIAPTVEARSSLLSSTSGPGVTRMLGADGVLQDIAASPDRGLLAGAGADGSVRLWDVSDPREPVELADALPGLPGVPNAVALDPDGRLLAAAGDERAVYLYDVSDPAAPQNLGVRLAGPQGAVNALAFSPDGTTLVAGSTDALVRLWDVSDPAQARPLTGPLPEPGDSVTSVAFSRDGGLLAAGGYDRTVHLWEIGDGRRPDYLASVPSGPELAVFDVALSPDGDVLAGASADRNVYLWDISDAGDPERIGSPLTGPTSWVNGVTFSPDGQTVAAGSSDGQVWLWDRATGEADGMLPHPGPVTDVSFEPDGRALYASAADGAVRRWQLPGPTLPGATDAVHEVAYHPDLPVVALASGDGAVYLWDTADTRQPAIVGEPLRSPDEDSYLIGASVFSPDGDTLVAAGLDGRVWRWDVSDPEEPERLSPLEELSTYAERLAFSPDGTLLAGGAADGTVALWDVSDRDAPEVLSTMTEASANVLAVAFSPDGRTLVTGGLDSVVRVWDVTDPENPVLRTDPLTGPTNSIYWLSFDPPGETLAVGSADGSVRLWDLSDPDAPVEGPVMTGPDGYVVGVAFDPDGDLLAAASTDEAVWVWDVADRDDPRLHAVLAGATGAMHAVSFDHSGEALVAAGQDPTGRIWQVDTDAVTADICAAGGTPITEEEWERQIPGLPYKPSC